MSVTEHTPEPPRRQVGAPPTASTGRPGLHLPTHLLGKLALTPSHPIATLLETLILPLIALALGLAWAPHDPLQTDSGFPWPWLAPVVLALRYGPIPGLGGAAVLLVGWLALNIGHFDAFPQLYFLGGLVLVMLVGEFSSLWQARTRRAETLQLYLDQRLEHLVRQHYLLRLSHDRLEQELIGRPMSMRDALSTLRDLGRDEETAAQGPDTLLRLLAQYCQLEAAALYPVTDEQLSVQALASIGSVTALTMDDPLLQQCLQSHKLCHISQTLAQQKHTRYLVAAPLLDLAGELYGVLVVEDMPFFALQAENLQTMNLLLGYYTDGLSAHTLARPLIEAYPACPPRFAFELQRLAHIYAQSGVPSIIVTLQFHERALAQDLPQQILRLKRELDEVWLLPTEERAALSVLMPLGDAGTAEGYITRLEGWMQDKNSQTLSQAGVFAHVVTLDSSATLQTLAKIHTIAHA